jgi:hypothetical protein
METLGIWVMTLGQGRKQAWKKIDFQSENILWIYQPNLRDDLYISRASQYFNNISH